MSNNFCRLLSNGYKIRSVGTELYWNACCRHRKGVEISDQTSIKLAQQKLLQVTDWIPECNPCYNSEVIGDTENLRRQSFVRVPEDTNDGDCVDLEISFDTQCNAACMSCSEIFSSSWATFNKQHNLNPTVGKRLPWKAGGEHDYYQKKYNITLTEDDVYRSDIFLKALIEKVPMDKLRYVFILGGEPFYSKTHIKLLKHIKQVHPDTSKVRIRYQTNGSIFPDDDVIELWKDFGSVDMGLSIDGVGTRFEWLRWPIPWTRVEKNVRLFLEYTDVSMVVINTISPVNLLYWGEVEQWMHNTIPQERLALDLHKSLRQNTVDMGMMSLEKTPQAMRDQFVEQYGSDHVLSKVLAHIPVIDYHNMIEYFDRIDQLRSFEWRKIFPESAAYLTD